MRTLDGQLDLLSTTNIVTSSPELVRRHLATVEMARKALERRRRANTAPARLEGGSAEEREESERTSEE